VPLLGRIAAGGPILVEEWTEDVFPLPRQLVGEGKHFLLRVVGESMLDAAILDDDLIVIRQQPVAENGEIVAVRIDEAVTVKTWKRSGDQVWLVSHNPVQEPIPGDRAEILGKVVAVLRRV
jgi:repressor LexA